LFRGTLFSSVIKPNGLLTLLGVVGLSNVRILSNDRHFLGTEKISKNCELDVTAVFGSVVGLRIRGVRIRGAELKISCLILAQLKIAINIYYVT